MTMPLTKEAYVEQDGNTCPFCLSHNVQSGPVSPTFCRAEVSCEDCRKEWYDVYQLIGYESRT